MKRIVVALLACAVCGCEQANVRALGPGERCAGVGATGELARPAGDYVDFVGVASVIELVEQAGDERAKALLAELGTRHVSEVGGPDDRLRTVAAMGSATIRDVSLAEVPRLAAAGVSFAGLQPRTADVPADAPDWATRLTAEVCAFHEAVRREPTLTNAKVLSPTLPDSRWQALAPHRQTLAACLDAVAFNPWLQDESPTPSAIVPRLTAVRSAAPALPFITTQVAYRTEGERSVSESTQAKYQTRLFFELFRAGIARAHHAQVIDFADSAIRGHGMLRTDLSPKPLFTLQRNLIRLLTDPGPTFSPDRLGWVATPTDPRARLAHLLFEKRGGAFLLVLWLDEPAAVADQRATFQIVIDATLQELRVFRPERSPFAEQQIIAPDGPVTVEVTDWPSALEIVPACR